MTISYELNQLNESIREGWGYFIERKGVYEATVPIIDECYEKIIANKKNMMLLQVEDNANYTMRLETPITIDTECFIRNMTIVLFLYVQDDTKPKHKEEGSFCHSIDMDVVDGKAENLIFKVYLDAKNRDDINYKSFSTIMVHEIHHAYRWYNIVQNEDEYEKEKQRMATYKKYRNDFYSNGENSILNTYLYNTEWDEIASFSKEIYMLVKQNPDINIDNWQMYRSQCQSQKLLDSTKQAYTRLKSMTCETNPEFWNSISSKINEFYNTNNKPSKNRKWFLNRLAYGMTYIEKQITKMFVNSIKELRPEKVFEMRMPKADSEVLNFELERCIRMSKYFTC